MKQSLYTRLSVYAFLDKKRRNLARILLGIKRPVVLCLKLFG